MNTTPEGKLISVFALVSIEFYTHLNALKM